MLRQIICDKFREPILTFKAGLNAVIGDEVASNSIGKSSILMIIDFVFGGDSYIKANKDAVENLGHHEFKFSFVFGEEELFFSRGTKDYKYTTICDGNYNPVKTIKTDEYTAMLKEKYQITLKDISFRNIVGRYTRVYGKENLNEKKPLQYFDKEPKKESILALIKLFDKYQSIKEYELQIDKLTEELKSYVSIVEKVIEQTRKVNEGDMHIAGRIVSIFDEGARPIKRGKVHKAVEFGRKVLLVESEEGVITYYDVYEGNPGDETLLIGAVLRHWDAVGNIPKEVAADRGFYSSDNERVLRELGVKRVSIPKRGKKSKERQQYESRTWFRRLQRFRAGGEASISHMKRCRGLGRSSVRGTSASRSYVALGIMAQNLWRLARIMA